MQEVGTCGVIAQKLRWTIKIVQGEIRWVKI